MNEFMSTRFCAEVVRSLSAERLRPYLIASAGDCERALHTYAWNVTVSAAFFELLASIEVVVRNAVHVQLTNWNGRAVHGGSWFDNRHGHLLPKALNAVADARARIHRGRLANTDSVMLTLLPFGFWRYLLSNQYKTTLWPFAMRNAFPHLASTDAPKLFKAMAQLHRLRNRVAHHEPIHRRDLAADYAACCFVLGAVSPAVEAWATADARIPTLLAQRL